MQDDIERAIEWIMAEARKPPAQPVCIVSKPIFDLTRQGYTVEEAYAMHWWGYIPWKRLPQAQVNQ